MNFARLCMALFVLSIPCCTIFAVAWLALHGAGRLARAGKGGSTPFVDRLHSALKRMACCWAAGIAACAAGGVVLGFVETGFIPGARHFLMMTGAAMAAFVWGLVRPRVYPDGVDRVACGRRLAWGLLAFYLFIVFVAAFGTMNTVSSVGARALARGGHGAKPREFTVETPVYDRAKFRSAPSAVTDRMIPPKATDIRLTFRPGIMGNALGASAYLRCRVKKDALLEFGQRQGYRFRSDSYTKNDCPDGPQDVDFIHMVWSRYAETETAFPDGTARRMAKPYPKDFLAYNYRRASCGGHSFLYDVKAETLYADWSSN